ncbi:MAG: hypothetical protein KF866_01995 [Phycisphaeraceae bacterium]|nr:hypothetical protein [Phycisphaeraceae bacterium]MCW5753535.1 hypothetical protein [Phycisphaeraceae bacterium]
MRNELDNCTMLSQAAVRRREEGLARLKVVVRRRARVRRIRNGAAWALPAIAIGVFWYSIGSGGSGAVHEQISGEQIAPSIVVAEDSKPDVHMVQVISTDRGVWHRVEPKSCPGAAVEVVSDDQLIQELQHAGFSIGIVRSSAGVVVVGDLPRPEAIDPIPGEGSPGVRGHAAPVQSGA